jgi:RNA 3'-terminal phosphate cyclase (ATP)
VDEYLRDQLVVFQAMAEGRSTVYGGKSKENALVEPSLHAKTVQWVAHEMLGAVFDDDGGCEGVGHDPSGGRADEDMARGLEKLGIDNT